MIRRIHRLHLPLVFPAGIAPGEGSDYNLLTIARSGAGTPILRGTSLAGVLRHAWREHVGRDHTVSAVEVDDQVRRYFGFALGEREDAGGVESRLRVSDCPLNCGQSGIVLRTHHLRDRHLASVADGGLFALESCPPGTTTSARLLLHDQDDSPDPSRKFLQTLADLLRAGVTLGGKSNRGIGLAWLDGEPAYHVYELSNPDNYACWLDEDRAWRRDGHLPGSQLPGSPSGWGSLDQGQQQVLTIQLTLGIPRGQDLLVGDGQGLEHEIEPQRVTAADGRMYWRLPGASLRGLFRGWITRLAAREGLPVADSGERHQERQRQGPRGEPAEQRMNGSNLGWCFLPQEQRRSGLAKTNCPVASLFGTLFQAGRIHISDGYAACSTSGGSGNCPEEQLRRHVAIDPLSGGAMEGMLFDNTVLTAYSDGASPRFQVFLRVVHPSADEARWLARTLRALDLGLLRVGSSKSSGRLGLLEPPRVDGPHREVFRDLRPVCG